jgi:hypothetical protein
LQMFDHTLVEFSLWSWYLEEVTPKNAFHLLNQLKPSHPDPGRINMSKEYEGRDPLDIAAQAEQDLNSNERKFGVQDGTGFGGKTVGGGSTSSKPASEPNRVALH